MQDLASFVIDAPEIYVRSRDSEVMISLRLRRSDHTSNKYPISGFPRTIMAGDRLMSKFPLRITLHPVNLFEATMNNAPCEINDPDAADEGFAAWPEGMDMYHTMLAELSRAECSEEGSYCRHSVPITGGGESMLSEYPSMEEKDESVVLEEVE